MVDDARWKRFHNLLETGRSFLLTSHLLPDGDSIASEVALALHLAGRGVSVRIVNETPAEERYDFLTRLFPVESLTTWEEFPSAKPPEVAICLDVCSWDYLGTLGEWLRSSDARIVSVDHHHLGRKFGELDIVVEGAASTGEVLYRYFRAIGANISPEMAHALYASILFDTGGLRTGTANNQTIRVAAELTELGANHREICAHLFEIDSWPKLDLLRHALGTLQRVCNGRLAWVVLPEDLFRVTGARFVDGDGILDELMTQKGLELCVMFRQLKPHGVKATFRSRGRHDVGLFAQELGGGGRTAAAGVCLAGTLHQAMDRVLPRLHEMVRGDDPPLAGAPPARKPRKLSPAWR